MNEMEEIKCTNPYYLLGVAHADVYRLTKENKELANKIKTLKKQIAECPECSYDQTKDLTAEDLEKEKKCKLKHKSSWIYYGFEED